jgi:hypothetical protein
VPLANSKNMPPMRLTGVTVESRTDRPRLTNRSGMQTIVLNETSLAIWDLCDGDTTVDEMVEAVVIASGISESQARHDVEFALEEFYRLGVLAQ